MSSSTIPLADAPELFAHAPRTRRVKIGAAVVLLVVFAAVLVAALRLHTRPTSYFAEGGNGIVVIDLSASVDPRANELLARLLRTLADSDQRLGLVVFEEQAYELLPPGTRGDEIRPMLRFFGSSTPVFGADTPWSRSFLGGTSIGAGLRLAREIVDRTGSGSVLLLSDLEDASSDVPVLTDEIGRYRSQDIRLRVLPIFPNDTSLALFTGLVGTDAIVGDDVLQQNAEVAERRTVIAAFPTLLALLVAGLLVGLGVNEYLARELEWRTS